MFSSRKFTNKVIISTLVLLIAYMGFVPSIPWIASNSVMAQTISPDEAALRQTVMAQEAAVGSQRQIYALKIVGDYATVSLRDNYTAGTSIYQKVNGIWQVIVESGGAFSVQELMNYGVPLETAKQLVPSY